MNLLDLVDIERSKKNKLYPADSILIQLSATRGQMQYMNKSGPADAKYGVMMLKNKDINPRYLFKYEYGFFLKCLSNWIEYCS